VRELGIQISQGAFEHLAVVEILYRFKLLQHTLAGKHETLLVSLGFQLLGSQPGTRLARWGGGFSLLLLDRLAFPASRHNKKL
jgi:hypothetical protein